jgi:hypothetical protein
MPPHCTKTTKNNLKYEKMTLRIIKEGFIARKYLKYNKKNAKLN